MNDSYPSRKPIDKPQEKRSLLERLTDFISPEPESRTNCWKSCRTRTNAT
jgi:magnesium and cobalt transporter